METTEIEALINFVAKSGLEEVNIETEQFKLFVKRGTATSEVLHLDAPPAAGASKNRYVVFKSPMIGTFYRAVGIKSPPFVEVGTEVKKGQKLCIIEAMKLFNEIEVDSPGTIVQILVDDASPVEYDQPLFLIDPS